MKWLLFIPASILFPLFSLVFGFAYSLRYIIKPKKFFRDLDDKLYRSAISKDQMANIWMREILNDFCITKDGHKYGDEDDTISDITGRNERDGHLTRFGWGFTRFLSLVLGDNHSIESIDE